MPSGYFVQPLGGCKSFIDFTTGFGLQPTPAAIIVATPIGSGEIKLCERLRKILLASIHDDGITPFQYVSISVYWRVLAVFFLSLIIEY